MLSELLTSNTRAEVMRILFDGSGEEHYLRGMEKMTNIQINSLQKEVKHLESIDLITARKDGNRIYYRGNQDHPLYTDLVSIVEKTVGIIPVLKEKLNDSKIQCAFLFGSMAKNKEKATSDVDLIIIGEIGMRAISNLLVGVQESIKREINPHVYTEQEFRNRIKEKNHFITSVLKQEIKPIKGNVNEYR